MLIIITFIFPPFLAAAAPPREGGNESLLPGFFGIGCVMSKCHSKIEMVDVETRNPLRRMIKTSEMSCIKLHCLFDCWFVCLLQCVWCFDNLLFASDMAIWMFIVYSGHLISHVHCAEVKLKCKSKSEITVELIVENHQHEIKLVCKELEKKTQIL